MAGMRNTLPLFLLPLSSCGQVVLPGIAVDAQPADSAPHDAPVPWDATPTPDTGPSVLADAALHDAVSCVAYDFETTGQHLVSRFDLELASISGSNMLTWVAGDFGRRGFGVMGGPTDGLDAGEHITVAWTGDPTFTRFGYYPATRPARLLLTWADGTTSIIERDGNGGSGLVWDGESPVSIRLEGTGPEPIVLRSLSYCP
jgi:hypothetical protein